MAMIVLGRQPLIVLALVTACAVAPPDGTDSQAGTETGTTGDGDGDGDGDGEPSGDGDAEPPDPCAIVEFATPELEAAVRAQIPFPEPEPVPGSALAELPELSLDGLAAAKLGGLECATGLSFLHLEKGAPESLAPIAELPALGFVTLIDLTIASEADAEIIAGLPTLEYLAMYRVEGFALEPLAAATGLTDLRIIDNELVDLTPLGAIVSLEQLYLQSNLIADIGPLAALTSLRRLDFSGNQVTEIGALAGLLMLEVLGLEDNDVASLAPLADHPALRRLYVDGNAITELVALPALEYLSANGNPIASLDAFTGHANIKTIDVNDTQITELGALSGVASLTTLSCNNCQITALAPDVHAYQVSLVGNLINDLGPVASWAQPTTWNFAANAIDDLAPLAAVPWTAVFPDCAFVFIEANPMAAPDNPTIAADLCANVGLTLVSDDDALTCAGQGCELPAP